jgi:elongator complex protein 1
VSETMYKETLKTLDPIATATAPQKAFESKVNRICDAFLAVLEQSQHKEDHLQNIITAHVSKTPPDLESGLEMIGRLQGNTSYHIYGSRLLTDVSTEAQDPLTDKAAEHICFLADVNQLYDTSLGIYNLELALLVAQQSQKVSVSAPLIKPSILTHW